LRDVVCSLGLDWHDANLDSDGAERFLDHIHVTDAAHAEMAAHIDAWQRGDLGPAHATHRAPSAAARHEAPAPTVAPAAVSRTVATS
ncbi:MAG: hypothetical protein MUE41_15910, partial [Gemmatimonadaceae bacterium]|nr:hypothetical protein [Gemmatimonadaceae bacterium]